MSSQDSIKGMVVVALRRIIRAVDLRNRYLMAHYGLTGPQLTVLRELSAHDGVSVGRLTRAIHLSQATVTGIVDRLEKRDLVRRHRSEKDKRLVEVWLTDAGQQLLIDAPPLLQEEFTNQFNQLEDWEKSQILSSLQRVVSMMETKHIDETSILPSESLQTPLEEEALVESPEPDEGHPEGSTTKGQAEILSPDD